MQPEIHPAYHAVVFTCSCGHSYEVGSTIKKDAVHLDVCSKCHPFYTGKQKLVDTAGRLNKFRKKYANTLVGTGTSSSDATK